MNYRRLIMAIGLLSLAACSTRTEPFKTDWLKIPDGKGMEWFYGYWIPPDQNGLDVYGSILVEPGKISYEENQDDNPPVFYRVLEQKSQYVLALTKDFNTLPSINRHIYYYSVFFPKLVGVPGKTIFDRFYWGRCDDGGYQKRESFGEELWQAPIEEVRAHWASFGHCNPNVKGGRAEKLFYQQDDPPDRLHPWLGGKVWGWDNYWRKITPECKPLNRQERPPWCG